MSELVELRYPQLLAAALCCGLALANAARVGALVALLIGGAVLASPRPLALALVLARFAGAPLREPVLLELAKGRSPPQGAILALLAVVKRPHGPSHGFDERTWLRRHGVHLVLRVDEWRVVGHRHGLGGVADSLRGRLERTIARGLRGDRAAVVEGVVLGDDGGLPEGLRGRFRAAGLYHLLAVSGENVILVVMSVLVAAWLVGLPRLLAQVAAGTINVAR